MERLLNDVMGVLNRMALITLVEYQYSQLRLEAMAIIKIAMFYYVYLVVTKAFKGKNSNVTCNSKASKVNYWLSSECFQF